MTNPIGQSCKNEQRSNLVKKINKCVSNWKSKLAQRVYYIFVDKYFARWLFYR